MAASDPHQLILMLMDGALDRLAQARGCMANGAAADKNQLLSSAIAIIDELRISLDLKAGGPIAANLDDLYDYMCRQLVKANLHNRVETVDEVIAPARRDSQCLDRAAGGSSRTASQSQAADRCTGTRDRATIAAGSIGESALARDFGDRAMYDGSDTVILFEELAYQDILPVARRPLPDQIDPDLAASYTASNVRVLQASTRAPGTGPHGQG